MKKHPIDDLFAQKLGDWEPKPSPDLWKRIENRQEGKVRRLAGWYWYAAASVAMALMAGYIVWQNQSKVATGTKGELATGDQIHRSKGDTPHVGSTSQNTSSLPTIAEVKRNESKVLTGEIGLPNQKMLTVDKTKTVVQPQVQALNPVMDRIEVATIQRNETSPESLIPDSKLKTPLQPLAVRPEIKDESLTDHAKGRVIIVHIETDDVNQEDHKSSKLIRILRQLKNAKQGEDIEWDEIGFNPKKMVARADERLRNEEEKVSKKYQELKDKTKL